MNRAYEQLVNRLSLALGRLRSGELGGGALAWRDFFSWQAAVVGGLLALAFGLAFRLRLRTWIRRRLLPESASKVAEPSIGFYAETLRQLERIGLTRGASQTPAELAMAVERGIENSGVSGISLPLQFLTNLFYQCRFGDSSMGPGPESVDLAKGDVIEHAHQRGAGPVSSEVEQALAELTAGVDSILNRRDNAEQAT